MASLGLFDTREASHTFHQYDRAGGQRGEADEDQGRLTADGATIGVVLVEFGGFTKGEGG